MCNGAVDDSLRFQARNREPLSRVPRVSVPDKCKSSSRRANQRVALLRKTAYSTNRALTALKKLGGWKPSDSKARSAGDLKETARIFSVCQKHEARMSKFAATLAAEGMGSERACFARLLHNASLAGYGGVVRGEVVPAVLENISLPEVKEALSWEAGPPSVSEVYQSDFFISPDTDELAECIARTPAYGDPV